MQPFIQLIPSHLNPTHVRSLSAAGESELELEYLHWNSGLPSAGWTGSVFASCALQHRELSQKKNEINQQIKVCRVDIAERRSYIETIHRKIKTLEEEIKVKQSTVMLFKENAKSAKATNNLLLQYEQTLKTELESRKASYNHDMEVYEERIASYKKTFQSHKEYYLQNPLAQSLLTLQAEKEEIEGRIKACDDQIMVKQKELDHLTGPVVNSFSTEELPDSVYEQQPTTVQEKQLDHQTVENSDSSIDISSLHLNHSKSDHKTFVEANAEEIPKEIKVQDSSNYCTSPEKTSEEPWPCQQLDEQSQPEEEHTEEQDQEPLEEDQVLEQQSTVSGVEEVLEDQSKENVGIDEEPAPSEETSSQETNPQAKMTAVPSTPTFSFTFSPASSPRQGTSDTKSPAFLFSLNSGPSTPGFPGFGFDVGSSQEEDSSFGFTGSLFGEKKTTESKSSTCPEFLFNQPEQNEDFQFAFASKSQSANKETSRDDFPFSFNF